MKKAKLISLAVLGFLVLITFFNAAYIVSEMEQVIVTQFGRPVGQPVQDPGIHFKLPFIQSIHTFDKRFLEWDGYSNEVTTKDKRFIKVDTYARWRIASPLLFFQRVRDERGANTRIDDILDGETRNTIAQYNLVEVIRSSNRKPVANDDYNETVDPDVFVNIEAGRIKIAQEILAKATLRAQELGIEVLDLRFKRINYVEEVQKKIFERMISERERIADKFRSEGQGEASKILGDKERELKKINSEAYKTAQEIIGKADGQATNIYARAYNQSPAARDFYRFLKTMETYLNTINENDTLILSTKTDFFRYLERQSGQ